MQYFRLYLPFNIMCFSPARELVTLPVGDWLLALGGLRTKFEGLRVLKVSCFLSTGSMVAAGTLVPSLTKATGMSSLLLSYNAFTGVLTNGLIC